MKTAVEWLIEHISYTTTKNEIISYHKDISILVEKAIEMEKQQKLDLTNITRLEVINHAINEHPIGRILTMYKETEDFTVVEAEFQDGKRTLKIFIS